MLVCESCGTSNPAGAKFCIQCGNRLGEKCPSCGAIQIEGARFCGNCGARFAAALSPPAAREAAPLPSPPLAERRVVTVLFADLVGFTPFADERDPEEVRETLSRYFELARAVIDRYGGTVEKFIGDAVMAVWGAPIAHEDDPERAVRAGLELVDAIRSLGPSFEARVGVLTGEGAVTLGAVGQGMVAGDLVNTASRLQSVALPGSVLVGEPTMRAASAAIAFEPAGEQTLKGKQAPVPAFRALRVVAERGGRNRSDALEAPFVGRGPELRLLKDLFHSTSAESRARLFSVIGPAGIGKSRLAWEFLKYVDGLVERVWWHQGRCPAYGEGITFWALGEMIRSRAGLVETDDEATTRAKVSATVAEHVPDPDERAWIEPALLALLGIGAGTVSSEDLFAAWRTFFERLAATGTVVMVFEDLQWADSGLLEFIDHLLEWSRNIPLYVVTLARPELLDKRPEWGAGKRSFTSVYLEPLPEPAMRELLTGLVPGLPETAVRAIVSRAEGVPLYAIETIRMLVAQGRLALSDGVYRPSGDLTRLAVPETLSALIAARLDALDAPDRSLLQDAAVLGRSFTPQALGAISGIDVEDLEPRLRALVRRELLAVEADPRSPERGQYAFVQALIREVAYHTLVSRERKARHLAAARYFESVGTDELAGALAGHYLAAYENSAAGAEADALAAQALISLKAAAERAANLGSYAQAVAFLEQALNVTADPLEEADLLERAGDWASTANQHPAAERYLRRAIEIRRKLGDRSSVARATAALGSALLLAYRVDDAVAVLEPAAAEFRDLPGDPGAIAVGAQLARAYFLTEEDRRAIETADQVLAEAERADLVPIVADTLITRGSALSNVGQTYEGIGAIETGERLAQAHGLTRTAYRGFLNRTEFQAHGDPRAGLEAAQRGLELARRLGYRPWAVNLLGFTGAPCALRAGEWDWALRELDAALVDDEEGPQRAFLLAWAVAFRAALGEPVDRGLAELAALTRNETDHWLVSAAAAARGVVLLSSGELDAAYQAFLEAQEPNIQGTWLLAAHAALWAGQAEKAREASELAEATGLHGPAINARRETLSAALAAIDGRPDEAVQLYRRALRAWRDLGLPWDEALTAIDAVALLDPSEPAVVQMADSAHELLTRLDARPFLHRLESLRARRPSEAAMVGKLAAPRGVT